MVETYARYDNPSSAQWGGTVAGEMLKKAEEKMGNGRLFEASHAIQCVAVLMPISSEGSIPEGIASVNVSQGTTVLVSGTSCN